MDRIQAAMATKKFKKFAYVSLVVILVGWVAFRFATIASENARVVFNAARMATDVGIPVATQEMKRVKETLYEPLAIKNNRAYVSAERAKMLRPGQRVGDGKITAVSTTIDYDTGMYAIHTSGVADGLQMAEYTTRGYFVPLYAISNGTVYVIEDGIAVERSVKIGRQDSENAYIVSGLADGDVVILSSVRAGDKVQIKK